MTRGAKLISIDAVDDLRAALHKFAEEAASALADLDLDVKRAVDWILHDRKDYWANEVRQGWDRVADARANLERRMIYRVSEQRPSAIEEKKALDHAKRRLETAQQKVQAVRHWSYVVQREMNEYVAVIGQMSAWLQNDLPRAQAALKRMSRALEAYVGSPASPEAQAALKMALARPEEPEEKPAEKNDEPGEKDESQPEET